MENGARDTAERVELGVFCLTKGGGRRLSRVKQHSLVRETAECREVNDNE